MDTNADRWAITAAKIAVITMALVVVSVVVLNSELAARGGRQAFTNTNLAAPFSALGFLGGAAALVMFVIVAAASRTSGHVTVARAATTVAVIEVVLYSALLVGYSARSREAVLPPGQEKFFCELDCHIGYTVTEVKRDGGGLRVSIRTRFDEQTIAPWRGNAPLTPNPRKIVVVDASGRLFDSHQTGGPNLTTPLRPGESYASEFSFTVPSDAREPRLLVLSAGSFPEKVMIGNENSFLHKKVYFGL